MLEAKNMSLMELEQIRTNIQGRIALPIKSDEKLLKVLNKEIDKRRKKGERYI